MPPRRTTGHERAWLTDACARLLVLNNVLEIDGYVCGLDDVQPSRRRSAGGQRWTVF
jgi:hypothetical protein